jgi:hypothetical protein
MTEIPDEKAKQDDDDNAPIIEDDPALGRYVGHYPSNRLMLLIRGGIIYAVAVGLLQLIFLTVPDNIAGIFLPMLFAGVGLGVAWYVLHLWNREVILYEHGFSYREGSRLAQFYYGKIVTVRQKAERVAYFGFIKRDLYTMTLISDQDEILTLNNVYSSIAELVSKLESTITRARLPIAQARLARSETLDFGAVRLSQQGIETDAGVLTWADFAGYRLEGKDIKLAARTNPDYAAFPVKQLDNVLLLLALLRGRGA